MMSRHSLWGDGFIPIFHSPVLSLRWLLAECEPCTADDRRFLVVWHPRPTLLRLPLGPSTYNK
jgi:hypothetical protein